MKLPRRWIIFSPAVLFCTACAVLQSPSEHARSLVDAAGFRSLEVADARMRAFAKPASRNPTDRVTVYVESDGAPWRLPDEPPPDPTPVRPLVLRMAIADPSPAVVYLGRPCQYLSLIELSNCDPSLWIRGRFSNEAVTVMNQAVDQAKRTYGASEVNLVGYSGGGAMAALIAERRTDVKCLVTIAAPLDTSAWTDALRVSRLDLSLNPADAAEKLRSVQQTHFTGSRDQTVPASTAKRFFERVTGATVITKEGYDHRCCWDEEWSNLRRLSCLSQ